MNTIVLGLGNTILSDDGVGIYTARKVRELIGDRADVVESETAGFDIMEILKDYNRAIIIDAIKLDGVKPGTVIKLTPDNFNATPRLSSFHEIDLVTALNLGKKLGFHMPREVVILAVQGKDLFTLKEGCLPEVEEVIKGLAKEVMGIIEGGDFNRISVDIE